MPCCFYKLIGVHLFLTEFTEPYLHKISVSWALRSVGDTAGETSFFALKMLFYMQTLERYFPSSSENVVGAMETFTFKVKAAFLKLIWLQGQAFKVKDEDELSLFLVCITLTTPHLKV